MSRAYGTRFRGSKVPSTVALVTENNDMMSDVSSDEYGDDESHYSKRQTTRRRYVEDEDDDEEYNEDEDDEDYNSDDDEYVGRHPSSRGPSSPSSSTDPFRALHDLSWHSSALAQQRPTTGQDGIAQVPDSTFLPPPPLVHFPMGNAQRNEDDDDDDGSDFGFDRSLGHNGIPTGDFSLPDDPNNRRNTWSAEEDKVLATLVNRYGPKKWGVIASHLPARNAKQCHQRWHYVLKPSISRNTWTEREDYIIFYYQRLLGNRWSQIAKYLPGRTGYAVRNRHSFLVKNYERGVRPQVPAEHFAYAPTKTRDVVTPQRTPLDVPAIPASAPSLSSPQEVHAKMVAAPTTPAAFSLSSPVWTQTPTVTTRREMAASVPVITALAPSLGSSLTSLEDPYGSRYANTYRQPLRFHLPPTLLPPTMPPPPAAYTYAPPGDTARSRAVQHQGPSSPSDSSVYSDLYSDGMEGGADGDMHSPLTLPLAEPEGPSRVSLTRGLDRPITGGHWEPLDGADEEDVGHLMMFEEDEDGLGLTLNREGGGPGFQSRYPDLPLSDSEGEDGEGDGGSVDPSQLFNLRGYYNAAREGGPYSVDSSLTSMPSPSPRGEAGPDSRTMGRAGVPEEREEREDRGKALAQASIEAVRQRRGAGQPGATVAATAPGTVGPQAPKEQKNPEPQIQTRKRRRAAK